MARRLILFFLFVFSSFVIVVGGYNCAQPQNPYPGAGQVPPPGTGTGGSGGPPRGGPAYSGPGGPSGLPEERESKCVQLHKDFKKYGAPAVLNFKSRALRDYLMGHESNYGLKCARLYVDMEKMEGSSYYEGQVAIAYYGPDPETGLENPDGTGQIFETGDSVKENEFNNWRGRTRTLTASNFAAIMESRYAALILRIDNVKHLDVGDGKKSYRGSGSVWIKMFRQYKGDKSDTCHRSGGYAHLAKGELTRNTLCWLADKGAYSCLPKGTGTLKNFNTLRGALPCYKKLADFGYLNIRDAFNLDSNELPDIFKD